MSVLEHAWPRSTIAEAMDAVARSCFSGLKGRSPFPLQPPAGAEDDRALDEWVQVCAAERGLEVEAVEGRLEDLEDAASGAAPALLSVGDSTGFLALVGAEGRKARILTPSGGVHRVPLAEVVAALAAPVERRFGGEADAILERLDLDGDGSGDRVRQQARSAILWELGRSQRLPLGWLVRLPPESDVLAQLREAGAMRFFAGFIVTHVVQYAAWLGSWWLIGRGALQGRLDPGWMVGWALLLAALVPLRSAAHWLQGRFALTAGTLLMRRLLDGALRQDPDQIRREGTGQMLGRVIESEAVESLALTGGLLSVVAMVEIVIATAVLGLGAAAGTHLATLAVVLVMTFAFTRWLHRRRGEWTDRRLELTYDLVERMVGHRTLVAQQPPSRWHEGQDRRLEAYLESSRSMDRANVLLATVPRCWLVLGICGLIPVFVGGLASSGRFAVGLGGILLVHGALSRLVGGLTQLSSALISWRRIEDLFRAAARCDDPSVAELSAAEEAADTPPDGGEPLLEAREFSYRYPGRERQALEECHLAIRSGERLLLEGPSGGGKSTLLSLLAGLRSPSAGLVLLGGLDHRSASRRTWRRRAAATPQFHENHVLTETFLFNLLMGRRWPPEPEDVAEAHQICLELGLGPLLETMPGGLSQMVGEMGWRLSHGERSRLFIARALLQAPSLLLLDESFGALDPASLRRAMACVERRANALVVVVHR